VKGRVKFEHKQPQKLRPTAWTNAMKDDDDDKSVVSIASKKMAKMKSVQAKKAKLAMKNNNHTKQRREHLKKQREGP
jgi:hypothetical protein